MAKPGKAKQWLHPLDDKNLDGNMYLTIDIEDPRSTGQLVGLAATCRGGHQPLDQPATRDLQAHWKFGGNSNARWIECNNCGLRLAYWPRKGYTGKHRVQTHPDVVIEAVNLVVANPDFKVKRKPIQAMIREIENRKRLESLRKTVVKKETSDLRTSAPATPQTGNLRLNQSSLPQTPTTPVLTESSEEESDSPTSVATASAGRMDAEATAAFEIRQLEAETMALQAQVQYLNEQLAAKDKKGRKPSLGRRSSSSGRRSTTPSRVKKVNFDKAGTADEADQTADSWDQVVSEQPPGK